MCYQIIFSSFAILSAIEGCVENIDTFLFELILAIANESFLVGTSAILARLLKAFAISFGEVSFAAPASALNSLYLEKAAIGIEARSMKNVSRNITTMI